jgi:hypothetical protein
MAELPPRRPPSDRVAQPAKYNALRYRVSHERTMELIYFGLESILDKLDSIDLKFAVREIERINQIKQARKDHRIFMARRKVHNRV